MKNTCPVCGYAMDHPASDFHICPSCGTEFGYEDAGRTHDELRRAWLQSGAHWWSPVDSPPSGWDPLKQLVLGIYANAQPEGSSTLSGGPQFGGLPASADPMRFRKTKRTYKPGPAPHLDPYRLHNPAA